MADPFSFALTAVAQVGISYLFPSEGPRIKDLKVSASTYGAAIPWAFGLMRVAGNMIWASEPVEHKKKKWAGKGGYTNVYTYTCSFAMGLCQGPIKSVLRIWADSKLIYDATKSTPSSTGKYRLRFYSGDEDQLPDSLVVADKGDNATAFRGMAYIIFDDFSLSDFGNRVPQITAEVYVGETTQTVQVVGYTDGIGTEDPISTGYAAGEGTFDWNRSFAFLRYGNEISKLDLKNTAITQTFNSSNFQFPSSYDLVKLLTSGRESSLYATYSMESDLMPIARLDPYSLQCVATFGEASNGSTVNTATSFASPVATATAYSDASIEYLLSIGSAGQLGLLRIPNLTYQWGEGAYLGGSAQTGQDYYVCGADQDNTGYPTFYILNRDSSDFTLTRLNGETQSVLWNRTGTGIDVSGIIWDSAVPGVLIPYTDNGVNYIAKWSADTDTIAWTQEVLGLPDFVSGQGRLLDDKFAWVFDGYLYVISTITGEFLDTQIDPSTGEVIPGDGSGYALPMDYAGDESGSQAFDSQRDALICLDGVEGTVYLNTATPGVTVGSIVQRLLIEGNLTYAQIDVSAINDIYVRGYGWASGTDVSNIISELQRLYLFDLVEREGLIVAVLRGNIIEDVNGSVTIPQDILGSSSLEAADYWVESRAQEAEIPAVISLTYMNYNDDYQTSVARSQRISSPSPTMFSRQQVSMQINVVLTPTEAKKQTRMMLYSQWAERIMHKSRLPWAYLDLDPGDVITVDFNDGRQYVDRLDRTEIGADFNIEIDTYSQDSGAYNNWDGIVADGGGSGSQEIIESGIALPFVLNTPLLRDLDDTGGSASRYYTSVGSGTSGTFAGGAIFRSINNIDYSLMNGADSDVEWGTVIGTLPTPHAGPFALDWETQLVILPTVSWFELESITDDELWAGANACLVGDEVIQFRDVVENVDGTWTIYNLLRGRRGTEYACDTHVAGERFVFLSTGTVTLQADTINSRGLTRYFKGVASGQSLGEAPVLQITYEPRDLMPYAPAFIQRDLPSTGDDIEITWARRTRLGGNLMDGTGDVSLSEAFERYEVYILDAPFNGDLSRGAMPTSYRRMYTTETPSAIYTGAEQIIDGFDWMADTLHLAIYQLSDAVGRGFPGVISIESYTPEESLDSYLLSEDGDFRITEDGDFRTLE